MMTGASRFVRSVLNCLGLPGKRGTKQDCKGGDKLGYLKHPNLSQTESVSSAIIRGYERATIARRLAEALRTVEQKQSRRHISDGTLGLISHRRPA